MFDLQKSPVRKNIAAMPQDRLTIFEQNQLFDNGTNPENVSKYQIRTILKDVENMLGNVEENKEKQVKIAVIGEVKAGKSTFINACVEREIAYTDILEATALVSEITYAEEEYARIIGKDGQTVKECSFEELLSWTENKLNNMEDFSEFDKIEIGVDNDLLEDVILVDTPGLLSITTQNHEITSSYIAQTDYIFWVLDSTNLGSKEVNDFIDKVRLTGKPMIGIINKVDTPQIQQEIKEYIQKEYGNIFEEFYFVSAYQACELQKAGDSSWQEKSGFDNVLEMIEDISCGKEHSRQKTQYYQLQREREVHEKIEADIESRKQYYDRELENFALINTEIKKAVTAEVENWTANEFYIDERNRLMQASGEEFQKLAAQYNSAEYYTNVVEDKYEEIMEFIRKKWEIVVSSIRNNASEVMIDFQYDGELSFADDDTASAENVERMTEEGMKDGAKKGALIGLAFAGYSAWLGPVAQTVTLAGALVPAVVPLAVAGGVVGAVLGRSRIDTSKAEQNEREKQKYVEGLYAEAVRVVKKEMQKNLQELYKTTDYYYNQRREEYQKIALEVHFDFTEPAYSRFIEELKSYIQDVKNAIDTEGGGKLQKPPVLEE